MNVSSVNNTNTNFKALRHVEVQGRLFKKNPGVTADLLKHIKNNESIKNFCDRWDTSLIIAAHNAERQETTTNMSIFYKKTNMNFWEKLFETTLAVHKSISLSGFGDSLESSVENLKKTISNCVSSHVDLANEKADEIAAKKAKKIQIKMEAKNTKLRRKEKMKEDREKLESLLEKLKN